jgi:hypothetical protein
LRGPDPHLPRELFEIRDPAIRIVDLEDFLGSLEGPVDSDSKRIKVLRAEGGPTQLLVHRNKELMAQQISPRADGPKVRNGGHDVRYVASLPRILDRFGLDVVSPGEGKRDASVRRGYQGFEQPRITRTIWLA